jgi:hypothetical protein
VLLRAQDAPLTSVPISEAGDTHRVSAALGDIDGDRIADLVLGRNGPFSVRRGLSNAPVRRFADHEQPLGIAVACSCENPGQPQLVDFDGDGDLDLLALDTPVAGAERAIWFPNDGMGGFCEPVALRDASSQALAWRGPASALAVADLDADGALDLVVALPQVAPQLALFRGRSTGFEHKSRPMGMTTAGAVAFVDWNGDHRTDLLTVENEALVVREKVGDRFIEPQELARVTGDLDQARITVADWNGDGAVDVLLGETIITPAQARTAEDHRHLDTAKAILELIHAERQRIDQSPPPLDDAAAMARRQQRRAALDNWAAGPQAALEALGGDARTRFVSTVRCLLQK